jgi:hypothetical protein
MANCVGCGKPIALVYRWREDAPPVACEVEFDPNAHAQESFVEVALGEFASVFRHRCAPATSEKPDKYKPIHWNYKGRKKRCEPASSPSPTTPASPVEKDGQLELPMGIPTK